MIKEKKSIEDSNILETKSFKKKMIDSARAFRETKREKN